MKSVGEWVLYIGFALLVFYVVRNGIPFIDLQDLPDAILDSVSTHEEAELIPAKTMAGSEVCNDGIDVKILCVEILEYEGFRNSGKDVIIEGLESVIRKYSLTEKELTVGWVGFGSEGGLINYLGVVLWNTKEDVINDIAIDLCQYTGVAREYRALCTEGLENSLNPIINNDNVLGGYLEINDIDNGHTILIKDSTFDSNRDVREIIAHEYFHMYQRVHDKYNMSESMLTNKNKFPTRGPYWFIEGSAEYSALITANDNGWLNMKDQLQSDINEISYCRKQEDKQYSKTLSISENITRADHESLTTNEQAGSNVYSVSLLAVAYAVALSSHDSVMVDYWDDLQEYGPNESFIRNVGMSFEEFQIQFEELLDSESPNKQLEILMRLVEDN